jgi:hypothetical protein
MAGAKRRVAISLGAGSRVLWKPFTNGLSVFIMLKRNIAK